MVLLYQFSVVEFIVLSQYRAIGTCLAGQAYISNYRSYRHTPTSIQLSSCMCMQNTYRFDGSTIMLRSLDIELLEENNTFLWPSRGSKTTILLSKAFHSNQYSFWLTQSHATPSIDHWKRNKKDYSHNALHISCIFFMF